MSRHGPKDQSKQNVPTVPVGGDKKIVRAPKAPDGSGKPSTGGDNVRQISSSGGMTPSQPLGGKPDGI